MLFETQTCRWMGTGRSDGRVTYLGLRREILSLFHCVGWFVRKFYHRREPLWISARAELEASVGVMILTELDWARPWLSGVLASDASLPVTEQHRVSGIHQMSLRCVEFRK